VAPKSIFNQDGETKLKGAEKKARKVHAVRDSLARWEIEHRNVCGRADTATAATDRETSAVPGPVDENMLREGEVLLN
jgi:hypothetical protein